MAKPAYWTRFSGQTQAILRLLTGIFLDSGADVRRKAMFGHVAFVLGGHTFLLVGEWARRHEQDLVTPIERGKLQPTVIFPAQDEDEAAMLLKTPGAGYFAPSGIRLKSWVSTQGLWLLDEGVLAPLVLAQLGRVQGLPPRKVKNPGVAV